MQRPLGMVYTDLALETVQRTTEMPGLHIEEESVGSTLITRVFVSSPEAADHIGKPEGQYITIENRELIKRSKKAQEQVAKSIANHLTNLIPDSGTVLVIGLGNRMATPDSLGPKVVDRLMVTRHLGDILPPEQRKNLRPVAALTPGVLGLTGIETGEIIRGVVDRIKPDLVIAIDALASRSIQRILTTVQITNTGIRPGSGVGNKRSAITQETLGVPAIAIGIPTVVHATTIAQETIEILVRELKEQHKFYQLLDDLGDNQQKLIEEILNPWVTNLTVTPKEIDVFMEELADVVSKGLNTALQRDSKTYTLLTDLKA